MNERDDTLDDRLMHRLGRIAADVDGRPELVDEAARAALSTRRLDGELAQLVLDSALEAAPVRTDDRVRLLSFETAAVTLELRLVEAADSVTLRGLAAGAAGEVVVETPTGRRTADIDANGWFAVDGLAPGPARLRVRADDGTVVTTSWMVI